MNNTPDFWDQILGYLSQYKGQGVFAALAGSVAIFAWFVKDLLMLLGLNPILHTLTSVFIGYIGVDTLSKIIKGKAGVSND